MEIYTPSPINPSGNPGRDVRYFDSKCGNQVVNGGT